MDMDRADRLTGSMELRFDTMRYLMKKRHTNAAACYIPTA
jgi:hypothetical protein